MAKAKPKSQCRLMCCTIDEATAEDIRASVEAGRGKSMFEQGDNAKHGAMCRCGVPRKPPGIMRHVNDDGLCVVHPDAPPQSWTRGADRGGQEDRLREG